MKKGYKFLNCRGFTLVELLVAIGLLIIALAVAFTVFLSGNKIFANSTDRVGSQQQVRLAADYITREMRSAKAINTSAAGIQSSNNKYYCLMLKAIGAGKYLIKRTFVVSGGTTTTTEVKICGPLTALSFLPQKSPGSLSVKVSETMKEQTYDLDFDFPLDNIGTVSIPSGGTPAIYYAKNE